MKALDLYFCSFSDFSKPFRDNEVLYKQARDFWSQLDSVAWGTFGVAMLAGFSFAVYYYTVFNNKTGRHYKPKYWWIFMLLTFLITLLVCLILELIIVSPRLDGAFYVELKVAAISALYSLVPFIFVSFSWCNFSLPTNAYRYLKISK